MNRPVVITLSIIMVSAFVLFLTQNINVIDNNKMAQTAKHETSVLLTPEQNTVKQVAIKAPVTKPQTRTQTAIDRIRDITEKTELQKHLVSENESFNRYAEFNQKFESAKQDPTLMRHAIDERVSFSEDKEYALTLWADKKFYLKDQSITVNAILQNQDEKMINTPLAAVLMDDTQKILHNFELTQQGSGYLQATLDGAILQNASTGIYKIVIKQKQYKLQDSVSFILSEPNIELTGEYRDYINDNGDLIIEAQVKTEQLSGQAQSFYVQASLYSSTQVAIGATQTNQILNAGTHWLALSFDGLMILDTQESGPYELKHVSLARVTMPMQRAPLLQPDYSTQAYAYDEFH